MTRIAALAALVVTMSVFLGAQESISGMWEGKTPGGMSIVLDLAAKGEDLAGTMTVGKQKSAIEKGKVSKKTFTFSATMGGGTEGFTGELSGAEVKMWMDSRGPSAAITLNRVKPAEK